MQRHRHTNPLNLTIRPTILLVDDQQPYTNVMARVLSFYGFEVYAANSVAEAWELLDQVTPDLILLDVMMPRVDGITFLEELRAHGRLYVAPVLVVTAFPETFERAKKAGAAGYLTKPFSADELRDSISEFLTISTSDDSSVQ